jgi:hypothetical protein
LIRRYQFEANTSCSETNLIRSDLEAMIDYSVQLAWSMRLNDFFARSSVLAGGCLARVCGHYLKIEALFVVTDILDHTC